MDLFRTIYSRRAVRHFAADPTRPVAPIAIGNPEGEPPAFGRSAPEVHWL